MSKLARHGECNHCGECCLREGGVMVENPMIELHEDRCKFYVDKLNNYSRGHCLIFGRGTEVIEAVKDRYANTITPEQIRWFKQNCVEYPSAEDIAGSSKLPPSCGFRFEGGE